MILDRGTCEIYRKTSTTKPGGKPTSSLAVIHEGYYGELFFETSPARPTAQREETQTAARIRILQNRDIRNQDLAALYPFDGIRVKTEYYRITRAYHGMDDDCNEPITDLTLEVSEIFPTRQPGNGGTNTQESGSTQTAEPETPAGGEGE